MAQIYQVSLSTAACRIREAWQNGGSAHSRLRSALHASREVGEAGLWSRGLNVDPGSEILFRTSGRKAGIW